jgi:hypothetical protein
MSESMLPSPEPSLSASVYCAGRLDEIIHRCIAPYWREVRGAGPDRAYIRLLRYARGGEHLKIRIHAPEAMSPGLGASLEAAVRSCLDGLPGAPAERAERPRDAAPPIDVEDESPEAHRDRSFVWTRYRRSHVEFGGKPLLDDDAYVARMVVCQAEAAERVLSALKPEPQGGVPFRVRQNTLLKSAIVAVSALPWSPEHRSAYFAYHRDWLVRFSLAQGNQGPEKAVDAVARLDANLQRLGPGLEVYRKAAEARWGRADEGAAPLDDPDARFRAAIGELHRHVAPFEGKPGYQVDPFAVEPMFSALFKVLHVLGNQLGLKPSDEAFAHHLLLHVSGGGERHGFAHDPLAAMAAP